MDYGPSTNAVSLRILEAKSLLRSRVGRQHGRRGHWLCALAYAVEGFFLYFPCIIQKEKMKPPEATEPKAEKIT